MRRRHGFSLVELLVVVGIIAMLIALLLPTIRRAREQAQRTKCAVQMRQLTAAVVAYGIENRGRLPSGERNGGPTQGEHCIWISTATYDAISRYLQAGPARQTADYVAAGKRDLMEQHFACPNIWDSETAEIPYYNPAVGWVIGYNYLGGHAVVPPAFSWKSPMKLSDRASSAVWCDLNDWSPSDRWTIVSHRRSGAAGFYYTNGGKHPKDHDAAGGNVGLLDGSVQWRNLSEMKPYVTIGPYPAPPPPTDAYPVPIPSGPYIGLW
jgi:prepilin-type N-terminal cleavage/methylation domain-containing protein